MRWDVFCKVIDNHGDLGVCWRLAADLAARGDEVRLWVDDAAALAWMAPHGCAGVQVHPWADAVRAEPADVVVEAFGCDLEPAYLAALAARSRRMGRPPAWINLEYLSAETWVERCHGLPSPVLSGPAQGLTKYFFYPGFTAATGGLLREPKLLERQRTFDRAAWLRSMGIDPGSALLASLFCYEPPGLAALLDQLANSPRPTRLLVTAGRAAAAVRQHLPSGARGSLQVHWLPLLPQPEFDHLLWSCDFNFVRGEDSLVRALWAARPMAWNIYPQSDGAHGPKLEAFLDWLQAPAPLRQFQRAWNGLAGLLPAFDPAAWQPTFVAARERLLQQGDLVTQLRAFVADLPPAAP